jgi:Gpi18-like mannosyltransferase
VSPYSDMGLAPGVSFANDFGYSFGAAIGYLPFWPILVAGLYKFYVLLGSPTSFLYYFLIKQPIIICDVLVAYFLYRYVERRGSDKASFVMKVWLFSPFNIIVSAIWGMFDSIAVLFVLFALMARPGAYRGVWAGLATFAKSIPIIFAIPLSRGPKPIRNLALAIGIPVVATLAIVWLMGWSISIFGTTMQSTLATGRQSLSAWEVMFYLNAIGGIPDSALNFYYQWGGYIWIAGVGIATALSYRWFGFDTERGMIQSMLLITVTFLVLRGQVNEQYALYLYALALIDVALWSPQRRKLIFASVAAVLLYHVSNDFLLIRYVAPVYPHVLTIEANLISAINPERNFLLFFWAMIFWLLNVYFFIALYRERHARTADAPLAL